MGERRGSLFVGEEDIWKPFAIADDELTILGDFDYGCVRRLMPGVSAAQATADLNTVQYAISQQMADKAAMSVFFSDLQRQITGRSRAGLTVLLAAAADVARDYPLTSASRPPRAVYRRTRYFCAFTLRSLNSSRFTDAKPAGCLPTRPMGEVDRARRRVPAL